MSFSNTQLSEFSAEVGSRSPVPGGGGAAAYAGALGAALGVMASELTRGKKKYMEHTAELDRIIGGLDALRAELVGLVDGDAEAFEPLSRAYAIPHGAPGRAEEMERCLRRAARRCFRPERPSRREARSPASPSQRAPRRAGTGRGRGRWDSSRGLRTMRSRTTRRRQRWRRWSRSYACRRHSRSAY